MPIGRALQIPTPSSSSSSSSPEPIPGPAAVVASKAPKAKKAGSSRARSRARAAVARAKAKRKMTRWQRAGFVWPVRGIVTSRFGNRKIFGAREPHRGMDIACEKNERIHAAAGGTVVMAGRIPIYGKIAVIQHRNGYSTLYAHMHALHVRAGRKLEKNQIVGRCGTTGRSTGPHLHFEVRRNGRHLNPRPFMP